MVQRSGHSPCGYHGWSPWRTCFNIHIKFPWWDVANPEPPRRFQTIDFTWFYTVAAIWFWMTIYLPILESGLDYIGHFRRTVIIFTKYNHEIYFRSNCLGLLHVTGLSSWWISSKIQFCLVCVCASDCVQCTKVCEWWRVCVCASDCVWDVCVWVICVCVCDVCMCECGVCGNDVVRDDVCVFWVLYWMWCDDVMLDFVWGRMVGGQAGRRRSGYSTKNKTPHINVGNKKNIITYYNIL